ncbi:hypothetical protein ADUPG1_009917, partial [Aduncisulcus paluster]
MKEFVLETGSDRDSETTESENPYNRTPFQKLIYSNLGKPLENHPARKHSPHYQKFIQSFTQKNKSALKLLRTETIHEKKSKIAVQKSIKLAVQKATNKAFDDRKNYPSDMSSLSLAFKILSNPVMFPSTCFLDPKIDNQTDLLAIGYTKGNIKPQNMEKLFSDAIAGHGPHGCFIFVAKSWYPLSLTQLVAPPPLFCKEIVKSENESLFLDHKASQERISSGNLRISDFFDNGRFKQPHLVVKYACVDQLVHDYGKCGNSSSLFVGSDHLKDTIPPLNISHEKLLEDEEDVGREGFTATPSVPPILDFDLHDELLTDNLHLQPQIITRRGMRALSNAAILSMNSLKLPVLFTPHSLSCPHRNQGKSQTSCSSDHQSTHSSENVPSIASSTLGKESNNPMKPSSKPFPTIPSVVSSCTCPSFLSPPSGRTLQSRSKHSEKVSYSDSHTDMTHTEYLPPHTPLISYTGCMHHLSGWSVEEGYRVSSGIETIGKEATKRLGLALDDVSSGNTDVSPLNV